MKRHFFFHYLIELSLLLFIWFIFILNFSFGEQRKVLVGVYQNEPKIFIDSNGKPAGFFVDIIEEIASRESWKLIYHYGNWQECLSRLKKGEIDLMPDMAFSEERAKDYNFNKIPLLTSWSRIYSFQKVKVEKFSDLNGKKIAVVKGSIQETVISNIMRDLSYKVEIFSLDSFEDAFNFTSKGKADLVVVNHYFGDKFHKKYRLLKTSIDLNFVELFFATTKGKNIDLLLTIDKYISEWKKTPQYPYFKVLEKWIAKVEYRTPEFVLWIIRAGIFLIAVFVLLILFFYSQNKAKEFSVNDNDVGLPNNFNIKGTNTFGFHIIDMLIRQLDGEWGYKKEEENIFWVSFPLEKK